MEDSSSDQARREERGPVEIFPIAGITEPLPVNMVQHLGCSKNGKIAVLVGTATLTTTILFGIVMLFVILGKHIGSERS